MKFRLLPPAARELKKAARYYEERVTGLGFDFIAEIRAAIRRILAPASLADLGRRNSSLPHASFSLRNHLHCREGRGSCYLRYAPTPTSRVLAAEPSLILHWPTDSELIDDSENR